MSITITVEDGTVKTGANSYISLADWKLWADARGYSYSASSDEQIKAALVRAADYLNDLPWKGFKVDRPDPMAWPRYGDEGPGNYINAIRYPMTYWTGVLDREGYWVGIAEIPKEVIRAQCEAAWVILSGTELEPILERGGMIASESVSGAVSVSYMPGASAESRFIPIEKRLWGLLKPKGQYSISRA